MCCRNLRQELVMRELEHEGVEGVEGLVGPDY